MVNQADKVWTAPTGNGGTEAVAITALSPDWDQAISFTEKNDIDRH
jgi:hypothetical protein